MQEIKISMDDFDKLMEVMDTISMPDDDYIPSDDDLTDYIEKHPDRYYLYLLWFSEHKPTPGNNDEKKILKRITKVINRTIEITDEDEATEEGEDS